MLKVFLLLILLSASASLWAGPMTIIDTQEAMNSYIENGKFNGVILVAQDKKILFKKAFGLKNLTSNIPLSADDKFLIGSNTKQFVAASLLKLKEEGKISLDDNIVKYLPQYSVFKNITIRDLLNHTSGIVNFTDVPEFWNLVEYDKGLDLDDIINFSASYPLNFESKTNWSYSNTGYIIAGKIVELVSGKSWDSYIKNEFLNPLKMNNTGYEEYYEKVTDVDGHLLENGVLVPNVKKFNMTWALSAGALYSTVDDLLKWTAIYTDSDLLSEASKKEMQTPFKADYGLGIWVGKYNNETKINHGGSVPGFVSDFTYLKESKMTVITLDNVDGYFSPADLILDYFSKGKAAVVKYDFYAIDNEKLKDYTGTYKLGRVDCQVFIKNNKLFLQPNDGQPAYELVANDKDSFRLLPYNFGEEFVRNADGVVTEFIHYQSGNVSIAKKKLSVN